MLFAVKCCRCHKSLICSFGAESDPKSSVLNSVAPASICFAVLPFFFFWPTKLWFPVVDAEITLNQTESLRRAKLSLSCFLKFWLWKTKHSIIQKAKPRTKYVQKQNFNNTVAQRIFISIKRQSVLIRMFLQKNLISMDRAEKLIRNME